MRVYEKPPMFLASFLRFMAFRELLDLTTHFPTNERRIYSVPEPR